MACFQSPIPFAQNRGENKGLPFAAILRMKETMSDSCLIVIPARLAAARLPGKPLLPIGGVPMIVHVLRRAQAARCGRVIVAAADRQIVRAVTAAGGEAVLTARRLASGSDRVFAACELCDPKQHYQQIFNVQGDLPHLPPALLPRLAAALRPADDMVTPVAPMRSAQAARNPAIVKAVVAWAQRRRPKMSRSKTRSSKTRSSQPASGRAVYFSRAAVPHGARLWFHHIGVYLWRRHALERFTQLPRSALETSEQLEQLRALGAGMAVRALRVPRAVAGVDTAADLAAVRRLLAARRKRQSHARA